MANRYTALVLSPTIGDAPAETASLRSLGTDPPAPLGVASPGTSTSASASDHVHTLPTTTELGAVPISRTISTTSPLAGGGALSTNLTFSLTLATGSGLENSSGLRIATSAAGVGLTGGGGSPLSVSFGTTSTTVCAGDDARLSNSRSPTSHASTHGVLGSDPVTVAVSQVTGLGGCATLNVGTGAGTVAAGDDSRITGAAQTASNLSDLQDAALARVNLGVQDCVRVIPVGSYTTTVSTTDVVCGGVYMDPTRYAILGRTTALTLEAIGQVVNGVTGTLTLHNLTDSTDDAILSWTETSATHKTASVPVPVSAKIYELRLKKSNGSTNDYALTNGINLLVTWS